MFTKDQIKSAKLGTHIIEFTPGFKLVCKVVKVKDNSVWVKENSQIIKLNDTASQMLMSGFYK